MFFQKAIELDPNAKEAQDGMNRVSSLKYAARNDPEQVKARAMNDPEIQAIMGDPSMRMILEQVNSRKAVTSKLTFANSRCNKTRKPPWST